jgi:thiamine pyrophosphokinase
VRTRSQPIRTVDRKWEKQRNKNGPLRQCFSNLFLAYHCHNTKQVRVVLSQYKTCASTTATTQNKYACYYRNTKRTCTTATMQNKYACYYRNTKHVHLPPPQCKTSTRATIAIQNIYIHYELQILLPTFRILIFRSVSLWKPQISQLLLF